MKRYYAFRIASWLSWLLPSRVGYWLCSLMGGIVFYFAPHIRQAVMDNMRHVLPGSSAHERRNIARRVIRNTLKNYYDLVRLPHLKARDIDNMIPDFEGLENLQEAFARGKGTIAIGGHLGNFSLVAQKAVLLGYTVAVIAEDIQPPQLYTFVNKLRSGFGLKFIKAGSSQVRTIYKLLKSNGILLLASDRDVNDSGTPVQFFDAPADMPEGPVVLALRLGATILPVYTDRRADNKATLHIYPPMEMVRTGDYRMDIEVNMRRVAQVLEEMISRAPDQWVVLQRIWDREYTDEEGLAIRGQGSIIEEKQVALSPDIQVPTPSL
ncbi:MAG TPA: lysophospholipid acyltransferase family protein [Chloroflexia bacterium]|nr:lysophospholipid acyltransferase family protein [Chloroflexia bacterium]